MPRRLRFIPPGSLVEVTNRTVQGRPLLRPSKRLNEVLLGVLGRAQRQHGMEIVAVVCLSNHFHLDLRPRDAEQLAGFMRDFTGNLTKKVNRLTGWSGPMFDRRYASVVVSDEPAAMVGRLRYLLSNSVKENLVLGPRDWPGVESATPLCDGSMRLHGRWFDGRRAHAVRHREGTDCFDFPEPETVRLSKLPCWEHLDDETYRQRIVEMVREIEEEASRRHAREGTRPAGARRILRLDPQSRPEPPSRSPRPAFHALTQEARRRLEEGYRCFEASFRMAADRLRQGGNPHQFPDGAFPPAPAFVAA